jgi:hypothetical protein
MREMGGALARVGEKSTAYRIPGGKPVERKLRRRGRIILKVKLFLCLTN